MHGLLRRMDDDWCDPLELRPDSALGVPGLLQAARAGTVVMANALGSGFLESPAVQGFLPGISRRLLGEELGLPSLPTWWLGEAAALANVRDMMDGKVLRSTYPRGGRTSQVHEPMAVRDRAGPPTPGRCRAACVFLAPQSGAVGRSRRARRWCACTPSPTATAAGTCCPAA